MHDSPRGLVADILLSKPRCRVPATTGARTSIKLLALAAAQLGQRTELATEAQQQEQQQQLVECTEQPHPA